jgi:hypothetical protein
MIEPIPLSKRFYFEERRGAISRKSTSLRKKGRPKIFKVKKPGAKDIFRLLFVEVR